MRSLSLRPITKAMPDRLRPDRPTYQQTESQELPLTVAIDFDGTIIPEEFRHDLNHAKPRPGAVEAIKKFWNAGWLVIIWTSKSCISNVTAWLEKHGIPFDSVNTNPEDTTGSRKMIADVYIDDRAVNALSDWPEISKQAEKIMAHRRKSVSLAHNGKDQPFEDYPEARKQARDRLASFRAKLKTIAGGFTVKACVKTKDSFETKRERGFDPDEITDVLRGAVITPSKDEVESVVESLKGVFDVRKIDRKVNPDDGLGYHGAVHVDVDIDGMAVEIQVMPKSVWDVKQETEPLYDRLRVGEDVPREELTEARRMFHEANKALTDVKERLQKAGEILKTHEDPAPMPGYGKIFVNDSDVGGHEAEVWYVGGDGDEDGFSKVVEKVIREAFPAVSKIHYEAEGFPPKNEGWKQVYPSERPWTKALDTHGGIVPESLQRAKKVDLITLPDGVSGTTCLNCKFIDTDLSPLRCVHPEVMMPVTSRNCCKEWDAPGTLRAWEQNKSFGQWEYKTLGPHKFGCLMVLLPDELSRQILDWSSKNIPDSHLSPEGRETVMHVTVKYGFRDDGPEVFEALKTLLEDNGPMRAKLLGISTFPEGKDGIPLKVNVDCPELHELNARITEHFNCETKFPQYLPHVTLAYLDPKVVGYEGLSAPFCGREFQIDRADFSTKAGQHSEFSLAGLLPVLGSKRIGPDSNVCKTQDRQVSCNGPVDGGERHWAEVIQQAGKVIPQLDLRPLKKSTWNYVKGMDPSRRYNLVRQVPDSYQKLVKVADEQPNGNGIFVIFQHDPQPMIDAGFSYRENWPTKTGRTRSGWSKSIDGYRTKDSTGTGSTGPSGGQPGFTGKRKEGNRTICRQNGQMVPCKTEVSGTGQATQQTQLAGEEGAQREANEQTQPTDYSDPQFAAEWAAEVEKHLPEIEQNDVSTHEFSAQEAAAEGDWHKEYIKWRWGLSFGDEDTPSNKGKFSLRPADMGPAARFISGLLNKAVGGPEKAAQLKAESENVQQQTGQQGSSDMAEIAKGLVGFLNALAPALNNKPAADLIASLFGQQATPIVEAMAGGQKQPMKVEGQTAEPALAKPDEGLTDDQLASMSPEERREAIKKERADREPPSTELREGAEPTTRGANPQAKRGRTERVERLAEKGRKKGRAIQKIREEARGKAMSAMNETSGGALVPPPAWGGPKPKRKQIKSVSFGTLGTKGLLTISEIRRQSGATFRFDLRSPSGETIRVKIEPTTSSYNSAVGGFVGSRDEAIEELGLLVGRGWRQTDASRNETPRESGMQGRWTGD